MSDEKKKTETTPVPRSVAPKPKAEPKPEPKADPATEARETKAKRRAEERAAAARSERTTMKRYEYSGPKTGITFGNGLEVDAVPGTIIELPSEHRYTKALIERGYAVEATAGKSEG